MMPSRTKKLLYRKKWKALLDQQKGKCQYTGWATGPEAIKPCWIRAWEG